jgi:hypothetical protein
VNSKLFIVAGLGPWYLTFLVGFFTLAPSTDDGYYIIASLGTAFTGNPGFWIGDDFAPVFFLPTAFTYFYGLLLKLTMVLGFEFGPFGFRFFQLLFIFLLPMSIFLMLRRLYPVDHGIRFLILLVCLSFTHFVQSAITVRPEVFGALLFTASLLLKGKQSNWAPFSAFVLALSGMVHPVFTFLVAIVFVTALFRTYKQHNLRKSVSSVIAFSLPFFALGIYYLSNLVQFRQQTLGRADFLSADMWSTPMVIWDNILFWNNVDGIEYGLFSGYPAVGIVMVMLASTCLVLYRRAALWGDAVLWVCWPILFVQWFVFLMLPAFLPYLAISSFLASLNIVLLFQMPRTWMLIPRFTWIISLVGMLLCLVFVGFQGGKFLLVPGERLTPYGLYSSMSPLLDNDTTELYTSNARLIPPLIDYFYEKGDVRLNLTYLSPHCLQGDLLKRANHYSLSVVPLSDVSNTFWGLNRRLVDHSQENELSFLMKGSQTRVTLIPGDEIYVDDKNLIIRASAVSVNADPEACFDKSG